VSITDPISLTARLTAAARARESRRPDRLFDDPLASALAGPEGVAFMERLEAAGRVPSAAGPTENPYIAIRTRFFDDFLERAVKESGARQVVLLAAGLDTRAYRLDWPEGTRLFELDRPEVIAAKQDVLDRASARARCDRRVLGVDLSGSWSDLLTAADFDPRQLSVWLIEGLTPYLDEEAAGTVVDRSAVLAATGSCLGADVIGRTFLESPWTQSTLDMMAREGAPWKFGTDQPEAFFAARGWRARISRPGAPDASPGRWPYPVLPRDFPGIPNTFLVTAVRV
jgi:methyltransferase (TIGR00027 family)